MKVLIFIVAFCLCFGLTTVAVSFDGKREGFIIGGGLGPAFTSWTGTYESPGSPMTSETWNEFSIHTDFRIGGGFKGEQFMLYYWNKFNWFIKENVNGDKIIYTSGITGPGCNIYFQPKAPTFYLLGGLGMHVWGTPFEPESETFLGIGLMGGLGYEFSKHWSIEATATWGAHGHGDPETGEDVGLSAYSIAITVIGTVY